MRYYYVKRPLYGIEAGRVERFAPSKSGPLMEDGAIEPYDPANNTHRVAPGAPPESEQQTARRVQSRQR